MDHQPGVIFWGMRGSTSAGSSTIGNHTSCVELQLTNDQSLFFDAGTGIRVATENRIFKEFHLLLSHFHWDHIQGFPFVSALNDARTKITIYSGYEDAQERMNALFDPRFHPVSLQDYQHVFEFVYLAPHETIQIFNLNIQIGELNHPGKSFAFRVSNDQSSVVYATDSDYDPVSKEASELLRQADIAIVDSQYLCGDFIQKAHYGHSSFQRAVDVCAEHHVRHCVLYHLDPAYTDEQLRGLERQAREYAQKIYGGEAPQITLAAEGLKIPLQF